MAYFGAAHAVLLGVALGFLLATEPTLAILVVCLLLAGCVTSFERRRFVPPDTLLGVLAHAAFAVGLIVVRGSATGRLPDRNATYGLIASQSPLKVRFGRDGS